MLAGIKVLRGCLKATHRILTKGNLLSRLSRMNSLDVVLTPGLGDRDQLVWAVFHHGVGNVCDDL